MTLTFPVLINCFEVIGIWLFWLVIYSIIAFMVGGIILTIIHVFDKDQQSKKLIRFLIK